ncbi:MAG: DUF2149 domain-containing protein [Proteobacteria bacterium]|nr:DUF2149 domain-containing protein [Pseudomonadota bacterium]
MKYFKKRRVNVVGKGLGTPAFSDDDPMTGVANLFDIGLVFIVGLIMVLFSMYHLQDLFSEKSELTILKKNTVNQEMEIITKKGKTIKAMKVSKEKVEGKGERLGIAYKLEDGSMVYVPE